METSEEIRLIIRSEMGKAIADLKTVNTRMGKTKKESSKLKNSLAKLKTGWVGAGVALGGTVLAMKSVVSAAMEQEKAEKNLQAALKTTGQYTKEVNTALKNHASELQKITTVGDETSLAAMQLGISMGISAKDIGKATEEAIGLSKVYKTDLQSSMKIIAFARAGDIDALNEYIPQMKMTKDVTKKATIANEFLAKAYKFAKDETTTFAGQMEQMTNELGDTKEVLGAVLLPMLLKLATSLKTVSSYVNNLNPDIRDSIVTFGLMGLAIGVLTKVTIGFGVATSVAFGWITAIAAAVAGVVLLYKNWNKIMEKVTAYAMDKVAEMINPWIEGLNLIIKGINIIPGVNIGMIELMKSQNAEYRESEQTADEEAFAVKKSTLETALAEQSAIIKKANVEKIKTEKKEVKEVHKLKKWANARQKELQSEEMQGYRNYADFMLANLDKDSKSQFRVWQVFAINKAIIDTYSAATAAMAAMSGIPVVGAALGIAMAGTMVAMGMQNVAKISAMKVGGAEYGALIKGSPGAGTLIRAGERNKSEAIIPLENEEAMDAIGGLGGTQIVFNVETMFASDEFPEDIANKIDEALYKLHQNKNSRFAEAIA